AAPCTTPPTVRVRIPSRSSTRTGPCLPGSSASTPGGSTGAGALTGGGGGAGGGGGGAGASPAHAEASAARSQGRRPGQGYGGVRTSPSSSPERRRDLDLLRGGEGLLDGALVDVAAGELLQHDAHRHARAGVGRDAQALRVAGIGRGGQGQRGADAV